MNGEKKQVICSATLANGMIATGKTSFVVKRPDERITANIQRAVALDKDYDYADPAATTCIHFGVGQYAPGITLATFPSSPNLFGGSQFWAQVINSTLRWRRNSGGMCVGQIATNYLDNVYPYTNAATAFDAPGEDLFTNSLEGVTDDRFTMWLMYKPPGANSIEVPLQSVNWNWNGHAQFTNGAWSLISRYPTSGPTQLPSNDTTNFPQWVGVMINAPLPPISCPQ